MPEVFDFPWLPTPPGETRLRGFAGEQTMFSGTIGVQLIADVPDGTSNTLMIIPAVKSVPWTQPVDLPYAFDQPLLFPTNGTPDEIPVLLADATVRNVSLKDETLWRKLITRNGGELFTWPEPPPEPKPTDPSRAEPQAAANSTIEERLQRVEDKLDLLLKKLNSTPKGKDQQF